MTLQYNESALVSNIVVVSRAAIPGVQLWVDILNLAPIPVFGRMQRRG